MLSSRLEPTGESPNLQWKHAPHPKIIREIHHHCGFPYSIVTVYTQRVAAILKVECATAPLVCLSLCRDHITQPDGAVDFKLIRKMALSHRIGTAQLNVEGFPQCRRAAGSSACVLVQAVPASSLVSLSLLCMVPFERLWPNRFKTVQHI